ncbi:helicase-related protein [Candidatus Poriferisocius sp.]|uniref:helicase-related protein n=1 Tax=Candidatus Poriferisocius sp. TaxID=3101276 RepID=UPI003B014911
MNEAEGQVNFGDGDRVFLPGEDKVVTVEMAKSRPDGGVSLFVLDSGEYRPVELNAVEAGEVVLFKADGGADPERTLAALWSQWMMQEAESDLGTALGSAPLMQYLHQHQAVYGAMLPQPMLRFLLADEPGTGKTIMAGLYLTEASRLGIVNRALVVCPAHLVGKWQDDFSRFFGVELRRITNDTVRERVLESSPYPFWVVSLHLASSNPQVREAVDPDVAGWDLVVADEAHRLTPTATTYFQVGLTVVAKAPRALLMTATPHRGSEWLFRSLMHLTDPRVFPLPSEPRDGGGLQRLRPGSVHFLRRMKEGLVDIDGVTPLFKRRTAHNIQVPLNLPEKVIYDQAQALVDDYFPANAVGLGRMVYGKRAASSLYALRETLRRRSARMGTPEHPDETEGVSEEDADERELVRIAHIESRSARQERREIAELVELIDREMAKTEVPVSKWPRLKREVLEPHKVTPGGDNQLVVFTEYADTAQWLLERFREYGYSTEMYSGRQTHAEREDIRARFIAGAFQVIVSTDAGNEGIDLQSARVLVNWDVPWSLVTLEQRLGRIHRVGQTDDVDLFNLIAIDTREGDAHATLLDNLVAAANELDGKIFDSLALVGELLLSHSAGVDRLEELLSSLYQPGADSEAVHSAIRAMTRERFRQQHETIRKEEQSLETMVDIGSAIASANQQRLNGINPDVVERYLNRLNDAGLIHLTLPAAADRGLFHIGPDELAQPVGKAGRALVATSGGAKRDAVRQGATSAEQAITLGPNDKAFRDLVAQASEKLQPALYQGGSLNDPHAITDYRLFSFALTVNQGRTSAQPLNWRRQNTWSYLVKIDATGTRTVPWETLANLKACETAAKENQHPGDLTNAEAQALHEAEKDEKARRAELDAWLTQASIQLQKLPNDVTDGMDDPEESAAARRSVEIAVKERIEALKASTDFEVGKIELVGWAHVTATATPDAAGEDPDSEIVAMRHVTSLLNADGWRVADVHNEKLGYDLKATRGSKYRAVEVKGIKSSAATTGIKVTGAELATAGILGSDYWLYVVDNCADGTGQLFHAWPDPAAKFADAARDIAELRINGSVLTEAKEDSG